MKDNTTTLNLRGIDATYALRIKQRAQRRGLTIGDYVARLEQLHALIMIEAASGGKRFDQLLDAAGLQVPKEVD